MPSTRLNRDLISEIVTNVLNSTNLPAEREQITADTKKRVHYILLAKLPVEFRAIVEGNPREWFSWQDQVYAGKAAYNPISVMNSVFGAERYRDAYLPVEPSIPVPGCGSVGMSAKDDLVDLIERANEWVEKRAAAERELRGFLFSCRTVEQAVERMPELKPHVPPAAVKTNYPIVAASNALVSLTALGFDTTAKA